MPISKNPIEYYRYYCASQRRVEQWVQDTGRLLPAQQFESPTTPWLGFLEDPGLATPISPPRPLHKTESEDRRLAGIPEHSDSQDEPQHQSPEIERLDQAHVLDHDSQHTAGKRRPPFTPTSKESHDDSTQSQRSRAGSQPTRSDQNPVANHHAPSVPTSSKHSKDSKQSQHTSKSKKSSSSSARKRNSRKEIDPHRSIFAYVPYGVVPLFFAITTGSSALSLAAASVMLAGYFCLDDTSTAEKRHSRR